MSETTAAAPRLNFRAVAEGRTAVELVDGERWLSRCEIVPLVKRIGAATVRVDGIGDVRTRDDCRNRGYSRRVLEAAVARMRGGEAALAMLYGISNFYPKYGFATVGADFAVRMTQLARTRPLPEGWSVRPFAPGDLPRVRELYDRQTARAVGALVRPKDASAWAKVLATAEPGSADECRVVEDPHGRMMAYAWQGRGNWAVDHGTRYWPDWFFIGEVFADGPVAADAILDVCRAWAADESARRERPMTCVSLGVPPEGPVAAAARHQYAETVTFSWACGGPMARVLDTGRLLRALAPELAERWRAAGLPFAGSLRLRTDTGEATLRLSPDGIVVEDEAATDGERLNVAMSQTALARLALGGFPTGDLLDRLPGPPEGQAREALEALFPQRLPFTYLVDRY